MIVGRWIRSLSRGSPFGLPVCVARVPRGCALRTPKAFGADTDALQFRHSFVIRISSFDPHVGHDEGSF